MLIERESVGEQGNYSLHCKAWQDFLGYGNILLLLTFYRSLRKISQRE